MLYPTDSGFVRLVREPQFKDLVTVMSTDLKSIQEYRRYSFSRIQFVENSDSWPFRIHVYRSDLNRVMKQRISEKALEHVSENISPTPRAYRCVGFWEGGSDVVQQDLLEKDIAEFVSSQEKAFDVFRAYPLYTRPQSQKKY